MYQHLWPRDTMILVVTLSALYALGTPLSYLLLVLVFLGMGGAMFLLYRADRRQSRETARGDGPPEQPSAGLF
ncbi:hypothetical protein RIF23_09050 [Lipingzhangella sp. LS1_29]|uniref:Uncharacterized protein n=1 Tax=Lipingzhangella rawalii TaxID=2055835 RepID=A0ABU2H6I6_9ACTN|nr:hypothetical protein [Lipingzhangella rawalii]MDS1270440.1 hypothetical protein [Lipingzhangella rawalii]